MITNFAGTTAFLFLLASNAVAATDWYLVKKMDGFEVFVDRKSIRYDRGTPLDKEGDLRKMHILYSHVKQQQNGKGGKFYSETFVDEIACKKRTITTLSTAQYAGHKGDGAVILRHKMGVRVAMPIDPGSLNEFIMEMFVCDIG